MPLVGVGGRKVYYEWHGEERDTTPLVLVMGVGGSCRGWLPLQVPEFSKRRRVLIYENRGVGQSEDDGGSFTTADLAEDAVGLLDALGVARAHVLGAFLGGMIAQHAALRHPARVERLVLVGTWARPDAKRRMLLEDWAQLARAGTPWEAFIRKRLLWTLQDETLEQTDLIESMMEYFRNEGSPLSADLFARQCDACVAHDTLDRLREIQAPTLVVCGRHDQLTPPKFHREVADEIPGARLVTIAYGAHVVMVESAERFNQTVTQFLDEADSGRREPAS